MRTIRTSIKRRRFIEAIEAGDSVHRACQAAGLARSAAYAWRSDDADFADAWDAAIEAGTDRLEDEAYRRALDGSDTMLIFMLKSRRPERYRPPPRAMVTVDASLLADAEKTRRIRDMTHEEIEAEIADIERCRAAAEAASAQVFPGRRGNGADR